MIQEGAHDQHLRDGLRGYRGLRCLLRCARPGLSRRGHNMAN